MSHVDITPLTNLPAWASVTITGAHTRCILALIIIFLPVTSPYADTPAFASAGSLPDQPPSFTGTRGWAFYNLNPSEAIALTQLGVFDYGGDGLFNSHQIGVWKGDGTLLASATVPAGTVAPLVDGYRYVSIDPVTLPIGLGFYIVAAQYSAGDSDDMNAPLGSRNSPILFPLAGRLGFGSDLVFPSQSTVPPCPDCQGPIFWEPNLQYAVVPEPSTWLLLSPGLVYLFLRRRKTGKIIGHHAP